jgi:indole-3-glycerol phosphate synthase
MNILEKIVAQKRIEVGERKSLIPTALLEKSIYFNSPTVSLKSYLLRKDKTGIIAEFKRKSPSKGNINKYAKVDEVTLGYMQSGASALSVLTDEQFFGGSDNDLKQARKLNYCPILRKDFIIDEYQIIEARSIGADAILLIASVLSKEEIIRFSGLAKKLSLEVLLEIHNEKELEKIPNEEVLIGVNNRNLETFEVSLQNSIDLFPKLPNSVVKVAESGIKTPEDIALLKRVGYNGFLIGEEFMKTPNPSKACRTFIDAIHTSTPLSMT